MEDQRESPEEHLGKLFDELMDQKLSNEYMPTPLESYEAFKLRKTAEMVGNTDQFVDNIFQGILLYTIVERGHERTGNLVAKYCNIESNPLFQDRQAFSKGLIAEENPFGLIEEDFDRLLAKADKAAEHNYLREAAKMYQALIYLFPTHLESWLRWAYIECEHFFDYQKVLGIYQRCLDSFEHPIVYTAMGLCHIKGNEYGLAETCFNKSIELCDKFEETELKERTIKLLADMKRVAGA